MLEEAKRKLSELLLKMFDEFELRSRLPLEVPGGDAVRLSLPGATASRSALATAWAEQVAHMREQEAFYDALLRLRPRWGGEIGQVRELWSRATAQQASTQTPGPNGSAPANAAVSKGPWWRPVEAQPPLRVELELSAPGPWHAPVTQDTHVTVSFRAEDLRSRPLNGSFRVPWTTAEIEAMRERLARPGNPVAESELARWGRALRDAIQGFDVVEGALAERHGASGQPVELSVRAHQAALMQLPWELLMLDRGPAGRPFVLQPGWRVLRRIPAATARARPSLPGANGSLLFAWSNAGGSLPVSLLRDKLQEITGAASVDLAEVPHALPARMRDQAAILSRSGKPARVLCLLCHGERSTEGGESWSLRLGETGGPKILMDSGMLATLLGRLDGVESVVLLACGASNPGAIDNPLGSVAEGAWKRGVAVVAPQIPISPDGAVIAAGSLFRGLLEDHKPLASALSDAIADLQIERTDRTSDWASLTLLAPDA